MNGIVNILLVIYPVLGQSIPGSAVQTVIGCENTTISLSCPVASYVSILRANYGRFAMAVCNHQVDEDMRNDCGTEETSTTIMSKMCDKLSFCNVHVSSTVFLPVCPDTPKYLEVQYQCESNVETMSKIKQIRLPRMEQNINDVWSDRKTILTLQDVEEAVRSSLVTQNIQTTHKPTSSSKKLSNESMKGTLHIDHKANVNLLNFSENVSSGKPAKRGKLIEKRGKAQDTSSSPSDSELFGEGWDITYHDLVIIIISSSISVILIIITISVIILKSQTKSKIKQTHNLEMSETGSSFKSACSVYSLPTNINRPHIVSYQVRFNQLNPEVEIQHALENSSAVGQSGSVTSDQCCHHHDTMREAVNNNPDQNISVLRTAHLPSEIFACVYKNPELRT